VRGFTQDDAHIFCLPEQLSDEILGVLDLTEMILSKFGFDKYEVMLSTRPEKSVGARDARCTRPPAGARCAFSTLGCHARALTRRAAPRRAP
jgi:threonyl-tRNA synthetase